MSALEDQVLDPPEPTPTPVVANGGEPPVEWRRDKQGREYVRARGRRGIIYRSEGETVQEAFERDSQPRDPRPQRKSRSPRMPKKPGKIELRELEEALANGLKAPAMICAGFGDEWAADHFTNQGPYLARNLVLASEHNPWLRKRLEMAAEGQDSMMALVSLMGLGGACALYLAPPLVWWLNLPVPEKAKTMLGIPERSNAPVTPPPAPPADPAGAPAS